MKDVQELQDLIRQIQLRFSVFYGMNLSKRGVTLRQFSVLVALVRAGRLKMSELAKALRVSLPAITQMVDQMEEKQLVRRQAHPDDRRATLVVLTQEGRKVAAETQGKALRLLTEIFLGFPSRDRESIARFMRSMSRKLGEAIEESK